MKSDEYMKISKALDQLENHKYPIHSLEWCSDRICWAWRWRKITQLEMEELADRVTNLYS